MTTQAEAAVVLRDLAQRQHGQERAACLIGAEVLSHLSNLELPGLPPFAGLIKRNELPQGDSREDQPWSAEEDVEVKRLRSQGFTRREVGRILGRTAKAIERREARVSPQRLQTAMPL